MYKKSYKQSPYFPMWDMIITSWLPRDGIVLDLGCGVGQFAEMISDRRAHLTYVGYDFSKVAIAMAKKKKLSIFRFGFFETDITRMDPEFTIKYSCFVCLEALEHLPGDTDRKLLADLPKGKTIILSVPNYDSAGHYRTFQTLKDVTDRYGEWVDVIEHKIFPTNDKGREIIAVLGTTK